jgi:hypothetical protein
MHYRCLQGDIVVETTTVPGRLWALKVGEKYIVSRFRIREPNALLPPIGRAWLLPEGKVPGIESSLAA